MAIYEHKFKKGQKVRYVRSRYPEEWNRPNGTDVHNWAEDDGLILNEVYTVDNYQNEPNRYMPWFRVEEGTNNNFVYQEWQFEPLKPSNEERVRARLEKLNGS